MTSARRLRVGCEFEHSNLRFAYGSSTPLTTAAQVCADEVIPFGDSPP